MKKTTQRGALAAGWVCSVLSVLLLNHFSDSVISTLSPGLNYWHKGRMLSKLFHMKYKLANFAQKSLHMEGIPCIFSQSSSSNTSFSISGKTRCKCGQEHARKQGKGLGFYRISLVSVYL